MRGTLNGTFHPKMVLIAKFRLCLDYQLAVGHAEDQIAPLTRDS